MSYYRQQNRSRLTVGQDGNSLVMLIAINLVAFVLLAFIKVIYYFTYGKEGVPIYHDQVLDWVALPADFSTFISRPWTLITHFIVHDSVWHIIANMLWMWCFGYIFQDLAGNRKLIPVFIYGALAGAVAFMLSYNLLPPLREHLSEASAIGASAGVMAIAIAATALAPNYRIFPMINGGIPLWVLTMLFAIIDLATIPYNNPGGHIAHLAGAGTGFLLIVVLRKGYDWSLWMNNLYDWANNLANPDKPKKGKELKTQLFYKSNVQPFKKRSNVTQQRIDDILDKINQKGYQSLSEEEKEILKRASQEDLM
ncbi:rhomboid family intramembrane serine protease [Paracnuella aquatica]|uniref:rhomboid family intramembrane serine protease n=1 Tax=Paracnuella aquatica TaxID=2268757 RepID=UPI000DEEDE55|nr:rhomboid family intramembrane serine protease [Paracnuella aquatica]RPD44258.1 rhomboid family intramembrane serine protease [Paracnuella aquatica]